MPNLKEVCAHKLACRQRLYPASWRQYIDDTCQRETEGTLAQCPQLVKMDCGHLRLYLRPPLEVWAHGDRNRPVETQWCAKCEEEAENANAKV